MSRATWGDHPIKLVRGARLSFGDAFDFRRMQRVQLARIFTTLSMKPAGEREPVSQSSGQTIAGLSLDIADHSTEPAAQLSQLPSHPSELSRVRVAARLPLGARPDAGVALAQFDAVSAYFSDRGRLFQADRGRHFSVIVDGHGRREATWSS
jgi:hypothetical protein